MYSQQVFAGAKLAASITVKDELGEAVLAVVNQEGCSAITEVEDGWATILIYKYDFVLLLYEEMRARQSSGPPSLLDVWSTGKLFGYSDYEISQYLHDHGFVDSVSM